jgi:hypothetical protein
MRSIVVTQPISSDLQLDELRAERVEIVSSNEGPVQLQRGANLVLHLVPLSVVDQSQVFDLTEDRAMFPLFGVGGMAGRFNVDGKINYVNGDEGVRSYVQLFHNGMIESAYVFEERNGQRIINLPRVRDGLIDITRSYLRTQHRIGVQAPITIGLSLSSAKGYKLFIGEDFDQYAVDRDLLLIPWAKVASFEEDARLIMKPLFDRLWNAAGVARCFSYIEEDRTD